MAPPGFCYVAAVVAGESRCRRASADAAATYRPAGVTALADIYGDGTDTLGDERDACAARVTAAVRVVFSTTQVGTRQK